MILAIFICPFLMFTMFQCGIYNTSSQPKFEGQSSSHRWDTKFTILISFHQIISIHYSKFLPFQFLIYICVVECPYNLLHQLNHEITSTITNVLPYSSRLQTTLYMCMCPSLNETQKLGFVRKTDIRPLIKIQCKWLHHRSKRALWCLRFKES